MDVQQQYVQTILYQPAKMAYWLRSLFQKSLYQPVVHPWFSCQPLMLPSMNAAILEEELGASHYVNYHYQLSECRSCLQYQPPSKSDKQTCQSLQALL